MTEDQANSVLTLAFTSAMPVVAAGVPFSVENESVSLPDSGQYAYLSIVPTTSQLLTSGPAGNRMEMRRGWVQVKLWTPAGDRTRSAYTLAEAVRSIFANKTLPAPTLGDFPMNTQPTATQPAGNDGKWLMQLSRTPWWYVALV